MNEATPISLRKALEKVKFLGDRTPETTSEEAMKAFTELGKYRDGSIFFGHYAGSSEWERHPKGDEIVMVIEGETNLFLLVDGIEVENILTDGELIVVPENVWHRFVTPRSVQVMTVTPQPTDHSKDWPENA
jgi:quercetin dioxygenase-like cupin family protein